MEYLQVHSAECRDIAGNRSAAIRERLRIDPFSRSEQICRDLGISREELIGIYRSLKSSFRAQNSWKQSQHASFFSIAADLMSRPDQLQRIIDGQLTFPLFVEYHSGGACPLHCSFCYNSRVDNLTNPAHRASMLQSFELRGIIDEIAAEGAAVLNIAGGGEPLHDAAVLDNLRHARERGLAVDLNTMGAGLTRGRIVEDLLGINQLRISLNAASSQTYARIAGESTGRIFEEVCAAIKNLAKRRHEAKSTLRIVTSFIIVPENFRELENMVALARDLGADCAYLRPDYGNITRPFAADELAEIGASVARIKRAVELREFGALDVSIGDIFDRNELGQSERQFLRVLRHETCSAHRFKIGIDAWGNVHRCALVSQPGVGGFKHILGNLRKDGSIRTIIAAHQAAANPPVADCREHGITCNVFEGYLNALISKLRADAVFGVPVAAQPFAADANSVYRQNGERRE